MSQTGLNYRDQLLHQGEGFIQSFGQELLRHRISTKSAVHLTQPVQAALNCTATKYTAILSICRTHGFVHEKALKHFYSTTVVIQLYSGSALLPGCGVLLIAQVAHFGSISITVAQTTPLNTFLSMGP